MSQFLIYNCLICTVRLAYDILDYQGFQPEDSNSKVLDNQADPNVDETTDSISSILRKEIEGKLLSLTQSTMLPYLRARTPLVSLLWMQKKIYYLLLRLKHSTKIPLLGKDPAEIPPLMEIDRLPAGRKRKIWTRMVSILTLKYHANMGYMKITSSLTFAGNSLADSYLHFVLVVYVLFCELPDR